MYVYIPENLDLDKLKKKAPFVRTIGDFNQDFMIYIISLIHFIKKVNNYSKFDGYSVPIYSQLLKNVRSNYNQYIDYLIRNGVWKKTKNYSTSKKTSNYYCFTEDYIKINYRMVKISDDRLLNKIRESYKKVQKSFDVHSLFEIPELTLESIADFYELIEDIQDKYLIQLDLDLAVYEELKNETDIDKKSIQEGKIKDIIFKNFDANILSYRDSNVHRLHSFLTRLDRTFRPYLRLNGKELGQVDIKNSQPYFSLKLLEESFWKEDNPLLMNYFINIEQISQVTKVLLQPQFSITGNDSFSSFARRLLELAWRKLNKFQKRITIAEIKTFVSKIPEEEKKRYIEIVTLGKLYEHIQELANSKYLEKFNSELSREDAKELVFFIFFSPNYQNRIEVKVDNPNSTKFYLDYYYVNIPKKIFSDEFPNINILFRLIKKDFPARLACILQRIESYAVIDIICKKIVDEKPGMPILTIHDSFVSTLENLDYLNEIAVKELTNFVGYEPRLKIEEWINNKVQERKNNYENKYCK